MFYKKSAVKNPRKLKPVPRVKNSLSFAKKEDIENLVRCEGKTPFDKIASLTRFVDRFVIYDHEHASLYGSRPAIGTLVDRKGDCVEQGNLLFFLAHLMVPEARRRLGITICKNPRGYEGKKLEEDATHVFVTLRENGRKIAFDPVGGFIGYLQPEGFCLGQTDLNWREYYAFKLGRTAEIFSLVQGKQDLAIKVGQAALKFDPNQYPIYGILGDSYHLKGEDERAEEQFQKAINLAPGIPDTYLEYGEFLYGAYHSKEWAKEQYLKASEIESDDVHVLNMLQRGLRRVGERKLARQFEIKRERAKASSKYLAIFNENWRGK